MLCKSYFTEFLQARQVKNGLLESYIPTIIQSVDDSTHEEIQKTIHRIKADIYWKGMKAIIEDFVRHCIVRQQHKWENLHHTGLLQPLQIPQQIRAEISMNFVEDFPKAGRKCFFCSGRPTFKICTFYSTCTSFYRCLYSSSFLLQHLSITWTSRVYSW